MCKGNFKDTTSQQHPSPSHIIFTRPLKDELLNKESATHCPCNGFSDNKQHLLTMDAPYQ